MTDRLHQALATAIADLEWFAIPHTVDQIIGLYSEALAGQTMRYRHGVSNDEMLEAMRASGSSGPGGKGGHSDPTADAALAGEPDAVDDTDGTLGAIDACLHTIGDAARELDQHASHHTARTPATPPANHTHDPLSRAFATARQTRIDNTLHQLRHAHAALTHATTLNPPPPIDHHLVDELVRTHIADSAAWLHEKATEIWRASRGETMPVAVQRERLTCEDCARHGVQSDVADNSRTRCAKCLRFRREYHVAPTADIVRSWDAGRQRLTPGMIAEAKAQAKSRSKRSA